MEEGHMLFVGYAFCPKLSKLRGAKQAACPSTVLCCTCTAVRVTARLRWNHQLPAPQSACLVDGADHGAAAAGDAPHGTHHNGGGTCVQACRHRRLQARLRMSMHQKRRACCGLHRPVPELHSRGVFSGQTRRLHRLVPKVHNPGHFPAKPPVFGKGRVKAAVMLTLFTSTRQSPCKPRAVQWPSNRNLTRGRFVHCRKGGQGDAGRVSGRVTRADGRGPGVWQATRLQRPSNSCRHVCPINLRRPTNLKAHSLKTIEGLATSSTCRARKKGRECKDRRSVRRLEPGGRPGMATPGLLGPACLAPRAATQHAAGNRHWSQRTHRNGQALALLHAEPADARNADGRVPQLP